jgi:hypothetical protein
MDEPILSPNSLVMRWQPIYYQLKIRGNFKTDEKLRSSKFACALHREIKGYFVQRKLLQV